MSYKNLDILTAAYQKLNVIDQTEVPSAEQSVVGLSVLNDVLADQQRDGMRLGWYAQTDPAATAPLQDADVNGVKLLLTRALAAHYSVALSPELEAEIANAETRLVKRYLRYFEANLSELPRPQAGPYNGYPQ